MLEQKPGNRNSAWRESGQVIKQGDAIPAMVWNDPSVLKDGNTYRMWLSGGDPRNLKRIVVQVYAASSSDGKSWKIDRNPVLPVNPDPRQWDSLRIETPSVVKVEGIYHMYYSGADENNAKKGIFAIGHATSSDGVIWKRDPANPVVRDQRTDKFQWGYTGAGEPGVVYNPKDKTFYLYYAGMRYSKAEATIGNIGILLAQSKDGSRFTYYTYDNGRALILTRNVENAIKGAWFGYSTPSAIIASDGQFHLFTAFIVAPGGPATARHVVIAHAVSNDGKNFRIEEENIFEAGRGDWKDHQVRSPTVVESDGELKMWFAGETRKPVYGTGIGFATRPF